MAYNFSSCVPYANMLTAQFYNYLYYLHQTGQAVPPTIPNTNYEPPAKP